jgi:ABC-type glycerol-3-phosphate transport system permease component
MIPRKVEALGVLFFSGIMSILCWRQIFAPFPSGSQSLWTTFGVLYCVALMAYGLVATNCKQWRFWFGFALAGGMLSLVKRFFPSFVAPVIGGVRYLQLGLWLAALLVCLFLVASAFSVMQPREDEHRPGEH